MNISQFKVGEFITRKVLPDSLTHNFTTKVSSEKVEFMGIDCNGEYARLKMSEATININLKWFSEGWEKWEEESSHNEPIETPFNLLLATRSSVKSRSTYELAKKIFKNDLMEYYVTYISWMENIRGGVRPLKGDKVVITKFKENKVVSISHQVVQDVRQHRVSQVTQILLSSGKWIAIAELGVQVNESYMNELGV